MTNRLKTFLKSPQTRRAVGYSFMTLNAVILIGGFVCFACGFITLIAYHTKAMALIHTALGSYGLLSNESLAKPATSVATFGGLVLLTSFLGCYTLFRFKRGILIAYIILMSGIITYFFTYSESAIIDNQELVNSVEPTLFKLQRAAIGALLVDSGFVLDPISWIFMSLHVSWKCCGVRNHSEWLHNVTWFNQKYSNFAARNYPYIPVFPGCCIGPTEEECQQCLADKGTDPTIDCVAALPKDIYQQGCAETITQHLQSLLDRISGVAQGFAAIQMIGLVAALMALFVFSENSKDESSGVVDRDRYKYTKIDTTNTSS